MSLKCRMSEKELLQCKMELDNKVFNLGAPSNLRQFSYRTESTHKRTNHINVFIKTSLLAESVKKDNRQKLPTDGAMLSQAGGDWDIALRPLTTACPTMT